MDFIIPPDNPPCKQLPLFAEMHFPETLAYAAGLLDSEGSICIVEKRVKNNLPTYYLVVNIANTHHTTIEWLHETFGYGTLNKPKPTSPKHKPITMWYMQSNPAAHFLQAVYPYLMVKQEQARVALDFYEYHRATSHHGTEETVKCKAHYRQQIMGLNQGQRGIGLPPPKVASSTDLATLAAFYDGEGSVKVGVRKSREKKGNGFGYPLFCLQVTIGNSDYPILRWYQTLFSGNLAPAHIATALKQIWMWKVQGDSAQTFLRTMLPYLKIKREQAILGIEFQDYHRAHWQALHEHCNPEVLARKEEYRQHISALALYSYPIKPLPDGFNA